jgi:hypothetical protein
MIAPPPEQIRKVNEWLYSYKSVLDAKISNMGDNIKIVNKQKSK